MSNFKTKVHFTKRRNLNLQTKFYAWLRVVVHFGVNIKQSLMLLMRISLLTCTITWNCTICYVKEKIVSCPSNLPPRIFKRTLCISLMFKRIVHLNVCISTLNTFFILHFHSKSLHWFYWVIFRHNTEDPITKSVWIQSSISIFQRT